MPNASYIEKWLTITPQEIGVGVLTEDHSVAMQLRIHRDQLYLTPAVGVALRMTPAEARRIGTLLQKKADEVDMPSR